MRNKYHSRHRCRCEPMTTKSHRTEGISVDQERLGIPDPLYIWGAFQIEFIDKFKTASQGLNRYKSCDLGCACFFW